MKYQKPAAEVIRFDHTASFMAYSGGPAGRDAAIAEALSTPAIARELQKGNRYHIEDPIYYDGEKWHFVVHVYNHGGHETLVSQEFVL